MVVSPTGFWNDWSLVGVYFADFDCPGATVYKAKKRWCVNGVYVDGRLRWAEPDEDIRIKIRFEAFQPHPDYPLRTNAHGTKE